MSRPRLHLPVLLLVTGLFAATGCARSSAIQVNQTPTATAQSEAASAAVKPDTAAAPFAYTAAKAEPVSAVVHRYLPQSSLMTAAELEKAVREANSLGKALYLKKGQQIAIPTLEPQPVVEHSVPAQREDDFRAIYLTGAMAGSANGQKLVERWRQAGGNAVVFDIKDSDGSLSVPFEHALAPHNHRAIPNLPKLVRFLHQQKMHAVARIALFRDENIAQHHSELAVRSRSTGKPWLENGKLVWTDTSNHEVQDYNIALAKWVAASGVDEVQFDYVRFPAEGNQKDAQFAYEKEHPTWQRSEVIASFLDRAYGELHPMGVLVSLDVFGVMAWQRNVDLAHTGQDIVQMAKHCDVISPMIYPSHFFGMDGYALPGDAPEHFIATSMDRFRLITKESGVALRPWLQAFAWKTRTYSPEYVAVQVKTSRAHGGIGFLLWNARNDYSKPYAAMPEMVAHKDLYFGKATQLPELAQKSARLEPASKTVKKPIALPPPPAVESKAEPKTPSAAR